MSSYKHLVEENNNMLKRLTKHTGVNPELAQGILRFVKCMVKPGLETIDLEMFSVVMATYMGISDQNSLRKVYMGCVKVGKGMTIEQCAQVLCVFYSDNIDMQIDYVFNLFDVNHDKSIDVQELSTFIKSCHCVTDGDDVEKDETFVDLCNMVFDTLDITSNVGITYENFKVKVRKNSLILSMLGQNLPSQFCLDSFKHRIVGKTNLQIKEIFGNIRTDLLFEPPDTSKPKYYPITLDLP